MQPSGTCLDYSLLHGIESHCCSILALTSDDIWTALRSCTSLRELDVVDTADDDIKIYEEPWEWFEPSAGTRFRRVH